MITEKWRRIPGHEAYRASTLGRIKGPREIILKMATHGRACYRRVSIMDPGGIKTTQLVHRLVASAWIGDPSGKQVMHVDGNPQNNAIENLHIGTQAENEAQKRAHGRAVDGCRNGAAKFTTEEADAIRSAPRGTVAGLARFLGMSVGHAYNIRHGAWRREA